MGARAQPTPTRWQAATGLAWTQYQDGDNWVVSNPASASIHLLTESAHTLWTFIAPGSEPLLPEELAARLASSLGRPLDDDLSTATYETIAFMDQAGLVRPVLQ
ncbi:MAG: hypothetical protein ABUS56_09685 [Acidobacteriota bacterium]